MTVKIRYNGKRFPRTVNLRGGKSRSFLKDRKELELDEYDAMLLLKSNTRLQPTKWEFSVLQGEQEAEETPGGWSGDAETAPEAEVPSEGKADKKGRKKGGK